MSKPLTILDSDPVSRQAMDALLEREGLAGVCAALAPDNAGKDQGQVFLWLGGKDEPLPKGFKINDFDRFMKPVRVGDILERIQAYAAQSRGEPKEITIGPYKLDLLSHEITKGKEVIRLTEKESRILALLAREKGAVLSREILLEAVWGYVEGLDTHTLETHIYRLRRKIERDPAKPEILLTVEAGYQIKV